MPNSGTSRCPPKQKAAFAAPALWKKSKPQAHLPPTVLVLYRHKLATTRIAKSIAKFLATPFPTFQIAPRHSTHRNVRYGIESGWFTVPTFSTRSNNSPSRSGVSPITIKHRPLKPRGPPVKIIFVAGHRRRPIPSSAHKIDRSGLSVILSKNPTTLLLVWR